MLAEANQRLPRRALPHGGQCRFATSMRVPADSVEDKVAQELRPMAELWRDAFPPRTMAGGALWTLFECVEGLTCDVLQKERVALKNEIFLLPRKSGDLTTPSRLCLLPQPDRQTLGLFSARCFLYCENYSRGSGDLR